MSNINFDNPYYLLIAIPLILLFVVPFVLAIRKENVNGHNVTSVVLHVLLAIVIAFASAGTKIQTVLTETNVYVVADVSYSTSAKLDTIDSYIKGLKLPSNTKLGVVAFGKDFEILSSMGDPAKVRSVKDATVDTTETDIAGALEFTGGLFKDDVIKRVVLITDGKPTASSDSYAITRAVDGLEAKGIAVDAIYLENNISSDIHEVQVVNVDYTRSAFINHPEEAIVTIQSTYETLATVSLSREGEEPRTRVVSLSEGRNNLNFELDTSVEGTFKYEVGVEVEDDHNDSNNKYLFSQKVTNELRVLFITENWSDTTKAISRYAVGTTIEIYVNDPEVSSDQIKAFIKRLPEGSRVTAKRDAQLKVPNTVADLSTYDEIVLSGVKLEDISSYGPFVTSLDTVVSQFGKSLMTVGNLGIQVANDEYQTKIENMLPIRFDNASEAKLFTIVFDSSRSMNRLFHMRVAKKLAIKLLDILKDKDEICIVNFYGDAEVLQAPTPINAGNRQEIIDKINGITATNGTVIHGGLKLAYDQIKNLDYADKQVMLISDGKTYSTDNATTDESVQTVKDMYAAGIVTSVFDVGRQGDNIDGSNSDYVANRANKLLKNLAEEGHGKYFYSHNEENVSNVTFGEMAEQLNGAEIKAEVPVKVAKRTDETLKDVDLENIPDVSAFVYSKIKPSATTVLNVEYSNGTSSVQVPLYAHWEYGKGKVATLTSKESDDWLKNWEDDAEAEKFLTNVYNQNIPDEKSIVPYSVTAEWTGTKCRVLVSPPNYQWDAYAMVKVTTPSGETFTQEMGLSGADFFYEFKADEVGAYTFDISYHLGVKTYSTSEIFCLSVKPEYDSFAAYDPSELYKALNGRGAVSLDGALTIENDETNISSYTIDLTVPLLITAVALFAVDIIIRKLKWEDIVSLFGYGNKNKDKGGK